MDLNKDYISAGIGITIGIGILMLAGRIKRGILTIFGGTLDKMEFAGICFLLLLTYMIIMEGNREHEWHLFNELYIFFVAGGAMTGLGLNKVLQTIKHIRTQPGTTVVEEQVTTTQTTQKTDVQSEVPK